MTARSESELYLSFELSQYFEIDPDDLTIDVLGGETLNVDTKFQGEGMVVKFDGAYWRRGYEERDSRKSEKLSDYLAQLDLAKQAQAAAYIKQFKDRKRQRDQGS